MEIPQIVLLVEFSRTPVPLWIALSAIWFTAAATGNKPASDLIRAVFAPILDTKRQSVSLGRSSLCVILGSQMWLLLRQPEMWVQMGWPPAMVLVLIDLFLLAYCFGDKAHVRAIATSIASSITWGGSPASLAKPPPSEPVPRLEGEQGKSHSDI